MYVRFEWPKLKEIGNAGVTVLHRRKAEAHTRGPSVATRPLFITLIVSITVASRSGGIASGLFFKCGKLSEIRSDDVFDCTVGADWMQASDVFDYTGRSRPRQASDVFDFTGQGRPEAGTRCA